VAIAIAAVVSFFAALGAAALGAVLSRRSEQKQWLRNECKRIYLDFLEAANGCTSVLEQYHRAGTSHPGFWLSDGGPSPKANHLTGYPERHRLNRARDESQIFGETAVIAAQERVYEAVEKAFSAESMDENEGKANLDAIKLYTDQIDGLVKSYTATVRKSFGR
jgi:hypothetical protein